MNKNLTNANINDVTDTALWVAAYRAEESLRPDALFDDLYASLLVGEEGSLIALRTRGSRYTAWSVVIRTLIIDHFIKQLIPENIDTVLNLGAGLDTRPYRLDLPSNLKWIEVDFSKIIDHKESKLKKIKPKCRLERVKLDLSDEILRNNFLEKISLESNNILVLTEGVIPYLNNNDARSLADALRSQTNFKYWITEYYSPEILNFLRTPKRIHEMRNAPFQFYPDDWFKFFEESGWTQVDTKYFGVESQKVGRTSPTPGWLKKTNFEESKLKELIKYYLGYSILK